MITGLGPQWIGLRGFVDPQTILAFEFMGKLAPAANLQASERNHRCGPLETKVFRSQSEVHGNDNRNLGEASAVFILSVV